MKFYVAFLRRKKKGSFVPWISKKITTCARAMLFLILTSSAFAEYWDRRAYYDDTQCKGQFTVGIQVKISGVGVCKTPAPLLDLCIIKGQDPAKTGLLKSSESSGCELSSAPLDDRPWIPAEKDGPLCIINI